MSCFMERLMWQGTGGGLQPTDVERGPQSNSPPGTEAPSNPVSELWDSSLVELCHDWGFSWYLDCSLVGTLSQRTPGTCWESWLRSCEIIYVVVFSHQVWGEFFMWRSRTNINTSSYFPGVPVSSSIKWNPNTYLQELRQEFNERMYLGQMQCLAHSRHFVNGCCYYFLKGSKAQRQLNATHNGAVSLRQWVPGCPVIASLYSIIKVCLVVCLLQLTRNWVRLGLYCVTTLSPVPSNTQWGFVKWMNK